MELVFRKPILIAQLPVFARLDSVGKPAPLPLLRSPSGKTFARPRPRSFGRSNRTTISPPGRASLFSFCTFPQLYLRRHVPQPPRKRSVAYRYSSPPSLLSPPSPPPRPTPVPAPHAKEYLQRFPASQLVEADGYYQFYRLVRFLCVPRYGIPGRPAPRIPPGRFPRRRPLACFPGHLRDLPQSTPSQATLACSLRPSQTHVLRHDLLIRFSHSPFLERGLDLP